MWQEKFTRDPDFWFGDGNIILLAGQTAFRVYKGLLAKHSVVFANMFASGTAEAAETFDDCPVVLLYDHPEDLKDFLTCMMPCSTVKINPFTAAPTYCFSELHAAIRLAHKYQCPDIELRTLPLLKRYYTAKFPDFDGYDAWKVTLDHPPPEAAIAAVNIARLTETPSMLPIALYLACTLEDRMLDGYTRRDGFVEHLTPDDLRRCLRARRDLAREKAALVKAAFTLTGLGAECKDPTKLCPMARSDICDDMQRCARGECDALSSYRDRVDCLAAALGMCDVCKKTLMERETAGRKRVWMMLPYTFGLTVPEGGFTSGDERVEEPEG